ncbi:unnamed protein product, partial [Owenia fusiformis]
QPKTSAQPTTTNPPDTTTIFKAPETTSQLPTLNKTESITHTNPPSFTPEQTQLAQYQQEIQQLRAVAIVLGLFLLVACAIIGVIFIYRHNKSKIVDNQNKPPTNPLTDQEDASEMTNTANDPTGLKLHGNEDVTNEYETANIYENEAMMSEDEVNVDFTRASGARYEEISMTNLANNPTGPKLHVITCTTNADEPTNIYENQEMMMSEDEVNVDSTTDEARYEELHMGSDAPIDNSQTYEELRVDFSQSA